LACAALDLLDAVRRELHPMGQAVLDLEEAQELIKRLAVGPEPD
jgi:hypothetical protein